MPFRDAARSEGASVSGWLAAAAEEKLRAQALSRFFEAWQDEHGAFTAVELSAAEAKLGLSSSQD
jgi:hypothetical protein